MTRSEIEKTVKPIIYECLRKFGEYARPGSSPEEYAEEIKSQLRPDVRRVSLLISLAKSVMGEEFEGEGLELGCGYGYLIFPMANLNPKVHWTGIEHPGRIYFNTPEYQRAFRDCNCSLVGLDFVHQPLPFADEYFSVVTFSETLEHLPVERVNFVLAEISRVLRSGGILITSSPNQASLENRLHLLKGGSVFDLPDEMEIARGVFRHIRLYTPVEIKYMMSRLGFRVECSAMESNNSTYRGKSEKSMYRRMYRLYEGVEQRLEFLRRLADTWYFVFRKTALEQPVKGGKSR
jgi:SAM-dependent methyltransferase